MCCVLVLGQRSSYELEGATASVTYQFDPITESKNDIATPLSIKFTVVPDTLEAEEHISLTFTVKSLNESLTITTSDDEPVSVNKDVHQYKSGLGSGLGNEYIVYHGNFEVLVTTHTDGVLTGDLRAELSCDNDLCNEPTPKVIVKETESECVH